MSLYDVVFWLLILLVAALAFAIESGITARHRRVVLSSIFAATITAMYMMFLVEDNSAFNIAKPPQQEAEKKKLVAIGMGGKGGLQDADVTVVDLGAPSLDDRLSESERLLSMAGGFTECQGCPLMIGVQKGEFTMGSPMEEQGRRPGEGPQKLVTIPKPFAVSRYEIKRIEYASFVKEARHHTAKGCYVGGKLSYEASWIVPGFEQGDHDPVVCVSWRDAKAYTDWLSKKTKRAYRLLNESEWEYIARAGTTGPHWQGRGFGHETALFGGARNGTQASGSYPENAFKIFDTSGSVWEFTADCYAPNLIGTPIMAVNPFKKSGCSQYVVRGGGWNSPADRLRSASRQGFVADHGSSEIGIRVARVLYEDKPAEKKQQKKKNGRQERTASKSGGASVGGAGKGQSITPPKELDRLKELPGAFR